MKITTKILGFVSGIIITLASSNAYANPAWANLQVNFEDNPQVVVFDSSLPPNQLLPPPPANNGGAPLQPQGVSNNPFAPVIWGSGH